MPAETDYLNAIYQMAMLRSNKEAPEYVSEEQIERLLLKPKKKTLHIRNPKIHKFQEKWTFI